MQPSMMPQEGGATESQAVRKVGRRFGSQLRAMRHDITHGLKLADDNQPKRNSGNPTARQGKTETCIEDPVANQFGVLKRSVTEDRGRATPAVGRAALTP